MNQHTDEKYPLSGHMTQVILHNGVVPKGLYESLSSPKANAKRWVFNWDLNTSKDGACQI